MGTISVEKADHLFWMGRYTERVFTTLSTFFKYYDVMIDNNEEIYRQYCERIAIPDIYGDKKTFLKRYINDETNTDSIYSNLIRAYDNALVCRDELSSTSLCYLELSMTAIKNSKELETPVFDLQCVIDDLYAFWGSIDDCVLDEESRNLIKCGRYLERVDLYMRLNYPYRLLEREFNKFTNRLNRIRIPYNYNNLNKVTVFINQKNIDENYRKEALAAIAGIF